MRLEEQIVVRRPQEVVWAYLGDVNNIARWDRGVSAVRPKSGTAPGVGFEFDTIGHSRKGKGGREWGKMSYRIADVDPIRGCVVQLTSRDGNARFFKSGEWQFRVEAASEGSTVICAVHFRLRFPWILLAPVFYGMRKAILRDLESLKRELENE